MVETEKVTPAENGDEDVKSKEVKKVDENHHKNPQVDYNPENPHNQGCRGGLTTRPDRRPYH